MEGNERAVALWEIAVAAARDIYADYCAGRANLNDWEAADRKASQLYAAICAVGPAGQQGKPQVA